VYRQPLSVMPFRLAALPKEGPPYSVWLSALRKEFVCHVPCCQKSLVKHRTLRDEVLGIYCGTRLAHQLEALPIPREAYATPCIQASDW